MSSIKATYCDDIFSDDRKDLLRQGYGDKSYRDDLSSQTPIETTFEPTGTTIFVSIGPFSCSDDGFFRTITKIKRESRKSLYMLNY